MSGFGNSRSFGGFGQTSWNPYKSNLSNSSQTSWSSYSKSQPEITELSNVKYGRYTDRNNGGTVVRTDSSKQPYYTDRNYKTNVTKKVQK